jgi:hypothetical protein
MVLGCAALGSQALPQAAMGQEERGSMMFAVFQNEPGTSIQLEAPSGLGTDIDLERNLGLQATATVARLEGYYRFGDHGRVDLTLFQYSRDATRQIDRTIEFGDSEYPVSTVVNTSADVTIFKAAYTFEFLRRERAFFGVTAGLYTASSRTRLNAPEIGVDSSNDIQAPLPVIGVRGAFDIGERVALRGSVEWFGITTNKASGRLTDANIGVDYSFTERIALGLAYDNMSMDVTAVSDRGFETRLDWVYEGPMLYLKLNFGR